MRKLTRLSCLTLLSTGLWSIQAAVATEAQPSPANDPQQPSAQCVIHSLNLPLNEGSDPDNAAVHKVLKLIEDALKKNEAEAFDALIHPSVLLPPGEKSLIFSQIIKDYDLKGKNLQRNALFQLKLTGSERTVYCKDYKVTGVVGPTDQWAVEYSTTAGNEQARIFFLLARVPQALSKKSAHPFALAHVNTQNWNFANKTPETWFKEAAKWRTLGAPLAAWAFGEAGRRIVEANPYFFNTTFGPELSAHQQVTEEFEALTHPFKGQKIAGTDFTIHGFTMVYKEDAPLVGIKLILDKETAVNDLIKQCSAAAVHVAPLFKDIRARFPGIECLPYYPRENPAGAPELGTLYQDFAQALKSQKDQNQSAP
jgi:hypothetical protein